MANDLASFAKRMKARSTVVRTLGNEVAKEASIAMLTDLIQVTPVDTSVAISNWQVGLGAPPEGSVPAFTLGRRGSTRGASGSAALAQGTSAIERKVPEEPLFVSNLTHYIGDLDRGTSRQFSGGFIARARIVFHLTAQDTVKRLLR